jgi:trehalose synthase-fused probable maltokinase
MSSSSIITSNSSWGNLAKDFSVINSLESIALPEYLKTVRWYAGKSSKQSSISLDKIIPFNSKNNSFYFAIINSKLSETNVDSYLLPISIVEMDTDINPKSFISIITYNHIPYKLIDAIYDNNFRTALLENIIQSNEYDFDFGKLLFHKGKGLKENITDIYSKVLEAEQSNSSIIYNDKYFLKLFRKLFPALNPDLEIISFLSKEANFKNIPAFAGTVSFQADGKEPISFVLLQQKVENIKDAWSLCGDYLNNYLFSVEKGGRDLGPNIFELSALLGKRTAEMHLALASGKSDAFIIEPIDIKYIDNRIKNFKSLLKHRVQLLHENFENIDSRSKILTQLFDKEREEILLFFHRFHERKYATPRIRIHGDYHLGQILATGNDVIILDFEGEPESTIYERRVKHSPLKDVAGMLRSFHYAVSSKLYFSEETKNIAPEIIEEAALYWYDTMSETYLKSYYQTLDKLIYYNSNKDEIDFLLQIHLLEKAIYELGYELNARPQWVKIPLKGIEHTLDLMKKFK